MKNQTKTHLQSLTECGAMIALAVALSWFKIPLWGNGGSVDLVSVPILLLAFRLGTGWGLVSGAVFGLVKCLIFGGIGWGLPSVLLDYVIAYAMLGLCGLFRGKGRAGLLLGTLVACVGRFCSHFLSGVLVWRIAVGESVELFGGTFTNSELYSLLYNGGYMLGNLVIALIAMLILYPLLEKNGLLERKTQKNEKNF